VIDRRDPAPGNLVFLAVLIVFFAFHLEDEGSTVLESDQVIRFEMMLGSFILIRNQQERPIVSHIAEDMVGLLLQIEGSGLLPGAVQDNSVNVGANRAVHIAFRRKINIGCSADRLIAVEDRQERRFAFLLIGYNGVKKQFFDATDIFLQTQFTLMLPPEVNLFGDVPGDNPENLWKKLMPCQSACSGVSLDGGLFSLTHQGGNNMPGDFKFDLLQVVTSPVFCTVMFDIFTYAAAMYTILQMIRHDPYKCCGSNPFCPHG
jgi:hypothetical protein